MPAIWRSGDTGEMPPEFYTKTVRRRQNKGYCESQRPGAHVLHAFLECGIRIHSSKAKEQIRKREAVGGAQEGRERRVNTGCWEQT